MRKRLICLLAFLWSMSALLYSISYGAYRIVSHPYVYFDLQVQAGVAETAGISESTLEMLDNELASYLRGNTSALVGDDGVLAAEVDGVEQPAFNDREMARLAEWQRMFWRLRRCENVACIAKFALGIPFILLYWRTPKAERPSKKRTTRSIALAFFLLAIPLGAFAAWAALDFEGAFAFFRRALFAGDLQQLNSQTGLLARIFPISVFAGIGAQAGEEMLWQLPRYLTIALATIGLLEILNSGKKQPGGSGL